uniref:Uncharacterized protein n=1 Tax=Leersia perrieri TaxID=77586 RepID=A0A0D9V4A9_9ORYZ
MRQNIHGYTLATVNRSRSRCFIVHLSYIGIVRIAALNAQHPSEPSISQLAAPRSPYHGAINSRDSTLALLPPPKSPPSPKPLPCPSPPIATRPPAFRLSPPPRGAMEEKDRDPGLDFKGSKDLGIDHVAVDRKKFIPNPNTATADLACMVVKPPTWGRKPRPNFGRRRPRPVEGIYPKGSPPNPPGSAKAWPFLRYPYVPIDPFPEPLSFPEPVLTNVSEIDCHLKSVHGYYQRIARIRYCIYMKATRIPKDHTERARDIATLWGQHDQLWEEAAEKNNKLGFNSLSEPSWFSLRTFGVLQASDYTMKENSSKGCTLAVAGYSTAEPLLEENASTTESLALLEVLVV